MLYAGEKRILQPNSFAFTVFDYAFFAIDPSIVNASSFPLVNHALARGRCLATYKTARATAC